MGEKKITIFYIQVDDVFLPPAGQLAMGGSSSKKTFIWQKKKKKSPLNNVWSQLTEALPNKKRKKSKLSLDNLNLDKLRREKRSQKTFSLSIDKKEQKHSLKFSLSKDKNEQNLSQKKFSVSTDKKEPISLKILSLGNTKKESTQTTSPERKEKAGGGLGNTGEQIKKKFSLPL